MEQNLENYYFGLKDAYVKILKKNTNNVIKSHACNQCDYASSRASHLRIHLKKHSGEKSNKCNQCGYESCYANYLRRHLLLKAQWRKVKKCNRCGFASFY